MKLFASCTFLNLIPYSIYYITLSTCLGSKTWFISLDSLSACSMFIYSIFVMYFIFVSINALSFASYLSIFIVRVKVMILLNLCWLLRNSILYPLSSYIIFFSIYWRLIQGSTLNLASSSSYITGSWDHTSINLDIASPGIF